MPTANDTSPEERFRACGLLMRVVTLLAIVTSNPSSTHATPSATTSIVWKRDQPSRSSRAGIRLRIGSLPVRAVPDLFSVSSCRMTIRQPPVLGDWGSTPRVAL